MWAFVFVIIGLLAGLSVVNRQPSNNIEPGELDLPTAEEGKELYVLFGTRDIRDPNVVWSGDIATEPVRRRSGKK